MWLSCSMTGLSYVVVGCQAVVAITFVAAAVGKLRDRTEFRRTLTAALGLPWSRTGAPAIAVAVAEAVTALAVVALPAVGLALAALLLVAFTAVLVSMIRRQVRVPCRCFGASNRPPGAVHLVRNAILFAVAATGTALAVTGSGPRAELPAAALAAGVG